LTVSKRTLLSLIAVAVIAALAYYVTAQKRRPSQPPAVVPLPAPAEPRATTSAPPPIALIPAPAPPPPAPVAPPSPVPKVTLTEIKQPAIGAPVNEVVQMLRDAADQGVPQAACRLGIELIRCARIRDTLVVLGNLQASSARAQKEGATASSASQSAAELSRSLAADQRLCSGVAPELSREAWRYVYLAAAAGNVAAMSRFVRDPGLNPADRETDEGWNAYRQSAADFLQGAIKGGDVRALFQGWQAARSGLRAVDQTIAPADPDKALQYATALAGLLDSRSAANVAVGSEKLAKDIGPERAEAARREGEKLRSQYFANATPIDSKTNDAAEAAECWK
jgi:hypothetical protein